MEKLLTPLRFQTANLTEIAPGFKLKRSVILNLVILVLLNPCYLSIIITLVYLSIIISLVILVLL